MPEDPDIPNSFRTILDFFTNSIPRMLPVGNCTGYFPRYIEILCQICNWASEASPTLGCSIEISGDIHYVGRSVCLSCSYQDV